MPEIVLKAFLLHQILSNYTFKNNNKNTQHILQGFTDLIMKQNPTSYLWI